MKPLTPDQKEFWDLHLEALHSEEVLMRYKKIKNLVSSIKPDSCLDLGCGTGELGKVIYPCVNKIYVGTDISLNRCFVSRSKMGDKAKFLLSDATALPLKSNYFDVIVCSEVVEHIPRYEEAIKEIARILKPGGSLILTTPNYSNPGMFLRVYLKKLIKKNGIQRKSKRYDEPIPHSHLLQCFQKDRLNVALKETFFFHLYGHSILPSFLDRITAIFIRFLNKFYPTGLYLLFLLTKK